MFWNVVCALIWMVIVRLFPVYAKVDILFSANRYQRLSVKDYSLLCTISSPWSAMICCWG